MLGIGSLDVGFQTRLIIECHSQCLASRDHMIVCHDQKFLIRLGNDDSGSRALTLLLGNAAEEILHFLYAQIGNGYNRRHHIFHNAGNVGCHNAGRLCQCRSTDFRCRFLTLCIFFKPQHFASDQIRRQKYGTRYDSEQ